MDNREKDFVSFIINDYDLFVSVCHLGWIEELVSNHLADKLKCYLGHILTRNIEKTILSDIRYTFNIRSDIKLNLVITDTRLSLSLKYEQIPKRAITRKI